RGESRRQRQGENRRGLWQGESRTDERNVKDLVCIFGEVEHGDERGRTDGEHGTSEGSGVTCNFERGRDTFRALKKLTVQMRDL
uniref:Uncharacterized protein n=1 Tax=Cucumis melo TaxID=3656 RepID=A0A9I9ECP5_CUCME